MAKGTDSDGFVVLSKVRVGLKREFAFALKAQAEVSGSLGRTRASRALENEASKRMKRAAEEELNNGGDLENAEVEEEAKSDVLDSVSDEELKSNAGESALNDGVEEEEELKNGVVEMVVGGEIRTGSVGECESREEEEKESEVGKALVDEEMPDLSEAGGGEAECEVAGKALVEEEVNVGVENGVGVEGEVIEKPQRRFTRSALKPKVEEKESEGQESNLERQKSTSLNSDSKFGRMRRYSGLKELLETGILEGQNVRYLKGLKGREARDTGLKGVITGTSILCHCGKCKGTKTIKPNAFELHAGSSKKRALEYIFLENGKTLRDIMLVCQNSPLETLEEAVQLAVGCLSINKSAICLNCKESMGGEGTRSVMLLCSSCMELKESRARPALAANHFDTSPKLVTVLKHPDSVPNCSSPNAVTFPNNPESVSKHSPPNPVTVPECTDTVPQCNLPKPVAGPKSPHSIPKSSLSDSKSRGKITRKDLRLHKLVFEEDVLPDGTEVAYYSKGEKKLVGYKKGSAIVCSCCNDEVSASTFEAHAGFQTRRKPYDSIYTSNGVSLHELSLKLSKSRKPSTENRDDLCSICRGDAGDLLFCDNCPRAFHKDCLSLPTVPHGPWYCKNCQNMIEKEKYVESHPNAVAAGRVAGVDPMEQITNRCIRIVTNFEEKLGGCALCRSHEFSGSDFGPGTVIFCDQCEKEYHVGCLKDNRLEELKELPKGKWFCCSDCLRVHSVLQKLVVHGEQKLPDSLLNVVREKHNEIDLHSGANLDVKWRVLNGKTCTDDKSLELLSKALAIFHDRFAPIVDPTTGLDFIKEMLYGGTIQNQEFGGMYCAIMTVNQLVVSAGMFRIYGAEVAELPLVATSVDYQGQGYFQTLFSCIERLLAFLKIKSLVLPAADEAGSIWKNRFGFEKLTPNEIHNYRKWCQMMIFSGTSMLRKSIPKCRILS